MPQDFSHQNLRGRSFKGQDLAGANFSGADIPGIDFRGANLRGVDFAGVTAGVENSWKITFFITTVSLLLILSIFLVIIALFIAFLYNLFNFIDYAYNGIALLIIFAALLVIAVYRNLGVNLIFIAVATSGIISGLISLAYATYFENEIVPQVFKIARDSIVCVGITVAFTFPVIATVAVLIAILVAVASILIGVGAFPCAILIIILSEANLQDADLSRAKLVQTQLDGTDFTGATLTGAFIEDWNITISKTNLSRSNLRKADLGKAHLFETNLTQTSLYDANLRGACLTGSCIKDWPINAFTNLDAIICDYIYLHQKQQERRPSSGNFAPGEFAKLFQKFLETVDLIFRNGIDWDAFAYSFKKVEVENQGAQLDVQSIEKKGDGILVVRVAVAPDADKGKIHNQFIQSYEFAAKALEAQYQVRLEDKDSLIFKQEAQINRLFEIVEQQGSVQKALVENPRKVSNYNIQNPQFAGGMVDTNTVNADQIGGNIQNNDA